MENPTILKALFGEHPKQFSHGDLKRFTENFKIKIGFGAYGDVYKGQYTDHVQIAVKVLVGVGKESFMAEVRTIGRAYHRNLVKLLGFCLDDNMKALVYEYMENGSLDRILYENHLDLEWEKLYGIATEIAKVLSYVHDGCRIIHYDIKAANVLIDSNLSPKLADFGVAKLLNDDLSYVTLTGARGTPGYAAPEMLHPFSTVTYKSDVYSFGMMLFEVLGRRRNIQGHHWFPQHVWAMYESGQLDELLKDCGIRAKNRESAEILTKVAIWCAQFTPERRPSMSTVAKMLEKEIKVDEPCCPFPSQGMESANVSSMAQQPKVYPKIRTIADESNVAKMLKETEVKNPSDWYWSEVTRPADVSSMPPPPLPEFSINVPSDADESFHEREVEWIPDSISAFMDIPSSPEVAADESVHEREEEWIPDSSSISVFSDIIPSPEDPDFLSRSKWNDFVINGHSRVPKPKSSTRSKSYPWLTRRVFIVLLILLVLVYFNFNWSVNI